MTTTDTLLAIAVLAFLALQVLVLPRLQYGTAVRLPDGSIPWLVGKTDQVSCGGSVQIALSFSVFSLLWWTSHVGSRLAMGCSWVDNPVYQHSVGDSLDELVEMWFGLSLMGLLLELLLAPYAVIRALVRDYKPIALLASLPWLLVACYTLWILSPLSVPG